MDTEPKTIRQLRKIYPSEEGWIHATVTLTTNAHIPEEDLKNAITLGGHEKNPGYEWAYLYRKGKTVKAMYREPTWKKRSADS